jgi:ribosomal protein L16 Arg81 hydroxylase
VLRQGKVPPISAYTVERDVIGHKRDGFADPAAIRRLMDAGGTLKLNQLSDWHRPTRQIVKAIESITPVAVSSYVFYTPPSNRGMLPHRDGSHVIAVQLEGVKEWHLYARPDQVRSTAGLDVDSALPSHQFTLEPGDVLYLPHGWPHDAEARDGHSLHLTFTLTEPTPDDLLEALGKHLESDDRELMHRHHALTLEAKSEAVRDSLLSRTADLPDEQWVRLALTTMRESAG